MEARRTSERGQTRSQTALGTRRCSSAASWALSRKVDIRLHGKGIQTPMAQGRSTEIIYMIRWIRTSRLSIKNSRSLQGLGSRGWAARRQGWPSEPEFKYQDVSIVSFVKYIYTSECLHFRRESDDRGGLQTLSLGVRVWGLGVGISEF